MPLRNTIIACELSLMLIGAVLLWRLALRRVARQNVVSGVLPKWEATPTDFFLFLWFVVAGGALGSLCAGLVLKGWLVVGDEAALVATSGGQLGILAGIGLFRVFFDRQTPPAPVAAPRVNVFVAGLLTFVMSLPVVTVANLVWQGLLDLSGLPAEKQDLIRMFVDAKSPLLLTVMIVLACIGAPIVEELVFRGGIFRYARMRLPRWSALLLPACLFAALHANLATAVPLVALGVVFSLAYERTGRLGTSMVAHALFNLNTILLILAGID